MELFAAAEKFTTFDVDYDTEYGRAVFEGACRPDFMREDSDSLIF